MCSAWYCMMCLPYVLLVLPAACCVLPCAPCEPCACVLLRLQQQKIIPFILSNNFELFTNYCMMGTRDKPPSYDDDGDMGLDLDDEEVCTIILILTSRSTTQHYAAPRSTTTCHAVLTLHDLYLHPPNTNVFFTFPLLLAVGWIEEQS